MSLYNELRPARFEDMVGQKQLIAQLKGLLEVGLPSSILLVGPRGVGKTTVARILAKSVNCSAEDVEPCNECQSCRDISTGASMDVLELDAASNNKVEDIRRILDSCMYTPVSKKKVYILDEVHMLSKAAFNCLLKTLEEPPAHCLFILCTTEEEAVPATILSRCSKFYFEQLDMAEIVDYLSKVCERYHTAYEDGALQMIARASEGCMRDALSILEIFLKNDGLTASEVSKSLGMETEDIIFQLLNGILTADLPSALSAYRESGKHGRSTASLLRSIVEVCCDTVYVKKGQPLALHTDSYVQKVASLAEHADEAVIMEMARAFSELFPVVSKTGKGNFAVEAAIIRMMNQKSNDHDLLQRIEALEQEVLILKTAKVVVQETIIEQPAEENLQTEEQPVVIEEPLPEQDVYSDEMGLSDMGLPEEEELPDFLPGDISSPKMTEVTEDTKIRECDLPSEPVPEVPETVEETVSEDAGDEAKPFVLPADIKLPEGTVISGSVSLEELDPQSDREADFGAEGDDPFQAFSYFARL